jgi:hypothetical protein
MARVKYHRPVDISDATVEVSTKMRPCVPASGQSDCVIPSQRHGVSAQSRGLVAVCLSIVEALIVAAGVGNEISPVKLGYWLRASKGQIVDGPRLCGELDRTKVMYR